MIVLGIESSCDETAASVVRGDRTILSNIVLSQMAEHAAYGGVVPEIAARAHIAQIERVIERALTDAKVTLADLDGIAVTGGPGLIGGVIVGVMTAKALASVAQKPFIAVNHLEGHALTARLTHDVPYPFLLLLASGGHCQFVLVEALSKYKKLGGTMDDALGEAFDKCAKLLGFPMPGGPAVERAAKNGDAMRFKFSIPLKGRAGCDFSFSGLKTAVRTEALALKEKNLLDEKAKADLCASFQRTACESVADRTHNALRMAPPVKTLVVAGGVAANQTLRTTLEKIAAENGMDFIAPPMNLCTDNAAMIAWAGIERLNAGMTDSLDFEPKARWPL